MRLKQLENKGIRVKYYNKMNDIDTIHGKLTYVSKDSIIVMGSVENMVIKDNKRVAVTESVEHVIKRNKIKSFEPVNYTNNQTL